MPADMLYSTALPVSMHDYAAMSPIPAQPYHGGYYPHASKEPQVTASVIERSWSPLAELSTELLMIMFEQLLEIDRRTAANARLVCARFNDIATPLFYRRVFLNRNLVSKEGQIRHRQALRNIFRYTYHITVPSNLDPYYTRRILDQAENLREITWQYVKINQWERWSWRPSHVLDMEIVRQRRLKLHIEDLPLDICGGDLQKLYIQSIPPDALVSLKLGIPTPPLTSQLAALRNLLLQAHNLRTLHYQDRGQGTHFVFSGGERLPPLRNLRLESYDWNHPAAEAAAHWDLSRLRSLELISMPVHPFLASVCFADLAGLRHLRVEDFSLHNAYLRRGEANALLHALVRDHVRALASLDLRVCTADFAVDAVVAHAASLRTLRLRDHLGFGDESVRVPTLPPRDVGVLAAALAQVHTLELDLDVHLVPAGEFLRALAAFPALHTLTLHVHTLVDAHDDVAASSSSSSSCLSPSASVDHHSAQGGDEMDRDRAFAHGIFRFLVRSRAARRGGGTAPRWRRIVVNVGGWQRVMVRRLSESWKALNKRGVFAERCFVLAQAEGRAAYSTGEEFGGGLFLTGWVGGEGEDEQGDMDVDLDLDLK